MSVAHLTIRELSTFVAIASARCQAGTLNEIAEFAAMLSRSNSAAFTAQYGDIAVAAEADELEAEALRQLAHDDLSGHFGPLLYNCITNSGTFYFGDLPADPAHLEIQSEIAYWRKIEDDAHRWQHTHRRQLARAEENAVAFDEVGQLPTKTAAELKATMGDGALIIATFRVNESDSMTDYYGGRTARTVVIGTRKAKRESFPSLRKAAAAFPPTADYGPGKNVWTVCAMKKDAATVKEWEQEWEPLRDERAYRSREFSTQAEAAAAVAEIIATHPECEDVYTGCIHFPYFAKRFGVDYREESLEHRENYSMGGGNYLGRGRYDGWIVKSTTYVSEPM